MKLGIKLKLIFFIILATLSFFQVRNFCSTILVSDSYLINCDNLFSQDLSNSIIDFINHNLKEKKPEEFCETLQSKFPVINALNLERKRINFINIDIQADRPIYIVNNLVLTKNFKLYPKHFFSDSYLESLNCIEVLNENIPLSHKFQEFVTKLPMQLIVLFNVKWENENFILLNDKLDPQFNILIRYNYIPDFDLIKKCKLIKQEQDLNDLRSGKFIADLRFDNQVIVSIT